MNKAKKYIFGYALKGVVLYVLVLTALTQTAWAFSSEMKKAMMAGPWELFVKADMKSPGFAIAVTVPDENKPTDIDKLFPIMGTAQKIRVEKYLPNLQWKALPQKYDGNEVVAQVHLTGPRVDQLRWLSTENKARSSVASRVGGIALKRLYSSDNAQQVIKQLLKPDSIGLISVSMDDKSKPLQFVINTKFQTELPDSQYKLKILKYVPHYTIDKETKKVYSQTDRPVNPAIQVQIQKGFKKYKQWIWAGIASPHMKNQLPVKVSFADFNLSKAKGYYTLLIGSSDKFWLLAYDGEKMTSQECQIGEKHLFFNEDYSVSVAQVFVNTILKDEWHNESDSLESPALIVTVQEGDSSDQKILMLNKAQQTSDKTGKAVIVFRKKMEVESEK